MIILIYVVLTIFIIRCHGRDNLALRLSVAIKLNDYFFEIHFLVKVSSNFNDLISSIISVLGLGTCVPYSVVDRLNALCLCSTVFLATVPGLLW